jgi:transposase
VLDPGRRRTKTGYIWAVARDDRPWAGPDPPAVVYLYAPGRGAEHAIGPLEGFKGILQVAPTRPTMRSPIPRATAVR